MGKYRKKPVVIEAFHWTGGSDQTEDPVWIVEAIKKGDVWVDKAIDPSDPDDPNASIFLMISTLEGVMAASEGDWIIKGVKGEIYPCKPDIFSATYDPVEPLAREEALREALVRIQDEANTLADHLRASLAREAEKDAEIERLREVLSEIVEGLTCGDHDAAHYCPNCDRTMWGIRAKARAALAGQPVEGK